MPDVSIKIVPGITGVAAFQPDLPGRNAGDPFYGPPSACVSWTNQTADTHQIQFDDGSYTSNEILPQFQSETDYIAPATYGPVTYHCTMHEGETGTIVIEPVVNLDPITSIVTLFAALALSALSAMPARAQIAPAPASSQIPCLAGQQPLLRIPEIVSKNGRLRATLISGTEQVRMPSRYPGTIDTKPTQPGDPQSFPACFPEWVRTFRSPDTTTPFPGPTQGYLDPMVGPTMRARVGDFVQLTFLNQIDPTKFGQSIDLGTCDSTSAGYPGGAQDTYPNCFHGSTSANIHYHGTHTNPNTTGDNVFLEILSSKRLIGLPAPPPPPSFDDFFQQCEAQLNKGSHVVWPVTWDDLPKAYTDMQKQLLQRFDGQPNSGKPLWPVNQKALDTGNWPQYYVGAYPYCFKLPKFPEVAPPPPPTQGAGSTEMQAHHGDAAPAVVQQGGPLKMGQSPGTHWYHAHKHGSTAIDVANGFVGTFIIEGQYDDEINDFYKAYGPQWTRTQPVMVINQFGTSPNLKGGAQQDKGPDFSVNGRLNPVVNMKPGEVQMWRIVNASGRAGALFLEPNAGLSWRVLAIDGVQLYTDNYTNSLNKRFLLASGNRIDLLVQAGPCATAGGCSIPVQVHNMVDPSDLKPAQAPARGPFKISLVTVKVAGTAVNMPFPAASPAKTFPPDLSDITDAEIKGTQIVDFTTEPQLFDKGAPPKSKAAVHMINGQKFTGEVGVSVLLNRVEEWKVTNNTVNISHPFHIHINPFQVTEVFAPNSFLPGTMTPMYVVSTATPPPTLLPGQCLIDPDDSTTWKPCVPTAPAANKVWWDVFPIPSGISVTPTGAAQPIIINGYFKMRSRFVDYPGSFVIHCHILAHEDRGMMTVVQVTPLLSKNSHH